MSGVFNLREYQVDAVTAGLNYFRNDKTNYSALMILPTGSGKSLVIAAIAKELNQPTLILQPSKEILEQNYNKLLAYGQDAEIFSASFNRKDIGLLTFATIGSVINKLDLFQHFKNIIIDECHLVNAKKGMYRKLLDAIGSKVIGLTATPYRLTTDGFGGSILKFLTRTRPRIFKEVIHYTQNGTLFDDDYLARLKYSSIDGFDSTQLQLNSTGADYTDSSVRQYYTTIGFVERLQNTVNTCLDHGRKNVLVFTRFIKESQTLINQLGNGAEIVTGETPARERSAIIERFRSGKTRIVSNVGVLTTGFDFPELETIIIARPTMSLALYYQMIGRGIRIHPNKECTWVVDMCDNFRKFGRVENLKLVAPKPKLWHIESQGRQLTNIYYGERNFT